jgi:hypothetical protein
MFYLHNYHRFHKFLPFLAAVLISCESLAQDKEIIWRCSISDGGLIESSAPLFLDKSKILCYGQKDKKEHLIMLNSLDGKRLWQWSDFLSERC